MNKILKQLNLSKENPGASTGTWTSKEASSSIASVNPADESVIASVNQCLQKDYDTVVEHATQAFDTWRQTPAPKRGDIVRQLNQLLREHKEPLGHLVSLEMGKSLQEGLGEVQEMIDIGDYAVGLSRMLFGKTMHSERPSHRMYEQWHPMGVTGIITAFNFPVAVWAWNAFIAAVCGNACVWKPSPKTPLCTVAVQHLCNQVMADNGLEGVFTSFVSDDIALSETFVNDMRVPLISFTGSTHVGRIVGEKVAKRFGRSILELSGNNAMIVTESADLALAIPSIVFGSVGTAGQRCTTTRRVFIHDSIYDDVVAQLVKAYKQVTVGDPLKSKNLMGPLIDEVAVQAFEKTMTEVRAQGGQVLTGGKRIAQKGYYVEPTIVEVAEQNAVVKRETFGPILYVIRYTHLKDALSEQNNVEQGLSSAIFTENLKQAECFLSSVGSDCGIANVNIGTSGAEIGGAFGGEKATGGGRESGSDAWKGYMRRQTNTINWGDDLPLAQGIEFEVKL